MKYSTPAAISQAMCALLFGSSVMGKTLYVGTGVAQILSYAFDGTSFQPISATNDSFPSPTWQTFDGDIMYSVSESGGTTPGAITSYTVENGTFTKISQSAGLPGPVHIAVTKNKKGINSFVTNDGVLQKNQQFTYDVSSIVADRQGESHPHGVFIDPTGAFAVIPDLGGDVLHVYFIAGSSYTNNMTPLPDVAATVGSGPRHGAFWPNKDGQKATHFFVVAELNNEITAYSLTYGTGTLTMTPITTYSTFGSKDKVPVVTGGPAAGEIAISSDNKFLYVSNRIDRSFPNVGSSGNGSDSLAQWNIKTDGTLEFVGLTPAGGLNPRHFSFVTLGGKDYVTVANPASGDVQLIERDPVTGKLAEESTAFIAIPGASAATWN
ncbi:uncharacterized protein H6S33_004948 [Morchella sextelata]|uniref:uncharacterized protein n=1 Tax=Morchella sextelata TaxID=1174677 RepID=UPI001D035F6B|nr:uncharacterized protein H6S33_004948 [Morchella sextelata]KAH0604966.1 hypothetical protein H6S33_004948 [Morchella sextelata]